MRNNLHTSTFLGAKVSVFKNVKENKPYQTSTFREWLMNEDESLIKKVNEIRQESNSEKRKKLKANLPCITGSGICSGGRKNENLKHHNGYIIIDIDYQDNTHLKNSFFKLKRDIFPEIEEVCYAGLSVSGNGYFLIIGIKEPEKHKDYFNYISYWLNIRYSIKVDSSCSNVSRLRLFSYDDEPYINENATLLSSFKTPKKKKTIAKKYTTVPTNDIEKLVREIEASGESIAPDYEGYFKLAVVFYNECGEAGRDYYHRVCRADSKYDERHCNKQFDEVYKRNYRGCTIKSLNHLMKQNNLFV